MSKIQKNFLSGALILTIANLLVKVIGAVYKIPLANLIDTVGMNYYNDAYQIYSLLFVISTAGVPIAIAKLVSESIVAKRLKEPKKILGTAVKIFAAIGFVLMLLVILFAKQLSTLLSNSTTNYCLYMIAPSIFLVVISATIKGYFQGYKCMTPSAVYMIIEAGFKLVGLLIVFLMVGQGVTDPMLLACGGVFGVSFGAFASAVFMVIRFLSERELGADTENSLPSRKTSVIAKSVVTLAIPISLSSAVMSVTSTLDMFLVKWSLTDYFGVASYMLTGAFKDVSIVGSTYGAYVGATSSLFNLPQALIVNIGVAVLPFLTTAFAKHNKEDAYRNMRSSSKLVGILALPCTLGMCFMSEPIVKLLYSRSYWSVGIPTLSALALSVYFVSFVTLTGVYLQSVGKVKISLFTMGVGAVVKLITNIVMVRLIGIMGAPIGTFLCYGSIALLNIIFIKKYIGFKFRIVEAFIKPLICSVICAASAYGVWVILCKIGIHYKLALFPALLVAVVVYAICILFAKILAKEDMQLLPKGEKIGEILARHKWIKE